MSIIQSIIGTNLTISAGGGGGGGTYPTPGSGDYLITSGAAGSAVSPVDPGGDVASVSNSTAGWAYYIKDGQFNTDNTFFNGVSLTGSDTYGGFGFQFLNQDNYAIQWVGYIYIPATGNYRLYLTADDLLYFWMGTKALDGNFNLSNYDHLVNNNSGFGADFTLTGNRYYPIRMWFQEWSGAERAQVFLGPENGTLSAMSQYILSYNGATGGH